MKRKNDSPSNESNSIFSNILIAFIELIGGTIRTKIGFALLLIIIGSICLFSPVEGKPDKPAVLLFSGYTLITIGIIMIIWKTILKKDMDKE